MPKKILPKDIGLKFQRTVKKKGTHSRVKNPSLVRKYDEEHIMCEINQCNAPRWLGSHHVQFKSQGGPDTNENLIALCRAHHDCCHGVHAGVWKKICNGVKAGFG